MLDSNFYIYRHIRPDTNQVFYIGKGSSLSKAHSVRAYEKSGRNVWWHSIVNKNNGEYKVEIIFGCETEQEINDKEIEFISLYGRRNLKKGTLVNLTNGGDGSIGIVCSKETRKKLSEKNSGEKHFNWGKKLSKETCAKKSETLKNSIRNLRGKKLPEWWKDKIRQSKYGEGNPMFGKKSPKAIELININTLVVYDSIMDAGEKCGMDFRIISANLKKERNITPFVPYSVYLEKGKEYCMTICNQKTKNRFKIINTETGVVYENLEILSKELGIKKSSLRYMVNNNKINYKYI